SAILRSTSPTTGSRQSRSQLSLVLKFATPTSSAISDGRRWASIRSISAAQVAGSRKRRTMNSSSSRVGTRWTPDVPASLSAGLTLLLGDVRRRVQHLVLVDHGSNDIVHQGHPGWQRHRRLLDHHRNGIAL